MATFPANGSNVDTWDTALLAWLTDTVFNADGSFKSDGLTDISGLSVADSNIIVGDGTNWVAESGATARTSLGLGTGDSPQLASLKLGTSSLGSGNALEILDTTIGTGAKTNCSIALRYNSTAMYGQHFMDSNGRYNIWAINDGAAGGNLILHADNAIYLNPTNNVRIGSIATAEEKLHVQGKVRADVAFNLNGTDGVSDTDAGIISDIDVSGGIVTSITKLAAADGNFAVGNGTTYVAESGDTARTSLGLGTGDSPQFASLGVGGATGSDPLTITQNSGTISFSHDGSDAYLKWSNDSLIVMSDEGTNHNTSFQVRGKGTGYGGLRLYDQDDLEYLDAVCISGNAYLNVSGSSPSRLQLQSDAGGDVSLFQSSTAGETKVLRIYGYRTGDAQRAMNLTIHNSYNDSGRFYGVSSYIFEGKAKFGSSGIPSEDVHASDTVRADTAFNLNGTDGLSQTTANPGTVTSSGGIITAMSSNPYGSMYADNITETVTVSASDTAYEVEGGFTTGEGNGVTFPDDHYLQVATAGDYLCTWSISADMNTAGGEIEAGLMIDGTAQTKGTSHATESAAAQATCLAGSTILALTAAQQVSLFVSNHTNTNDIVVEHANLNIVKIGS